MKRLVTTLVILMNLFGSSGAIWADALSDFYMADNADEAGDYAEAVNPRGGTAPIIPRRLHLHVLDEPGVSPDREFGATAGG